MIGFELNRPLQLPDCIISISSRGKEQCMIVMRLGRIRQETRRCFVLSSGFVPASESLEQAAVIEMEFAVIWLKMQRLFHVRCSRIKFGLRCQDNSKVHMRFWISRIEAECAFILFFRLLPSALFLQRHAVIKMLFGAAWHVRYKPCSPLELWNHEVCLPKPERA